MARPGAAWEGQQDGRPCSSREWTVRRGPRTASPRASGTRLNTGSAGLDALTPHDEWERALGRCADRGWMHEPALPRDLRQPSPVQTRGTVVGAASPQFSALPGPCDCREATLQRSEEVGEKTLFGKRCFLPQTPSFRKTPTLGGSGRGAGRRACPRGERWTCCCGQHPRPLPPMRSSLERGLRRRLSSKAGSERFSPGIPLTSLKPCAESSAALGAFCAGGDA